MQQSGDPLRIQVFNTLEDAILNGSYKEGDSLNELRLSKSLGVSRTPVREALMQLELEGLVSIIPNKERSWRVFPRTISGIYTR